MNTIRMTTEVGGHIWRITGDQKQGVFRCHLIELLGNQRQDVPLTRKLNQKLRLAVARALCVEVDAVKPISTDLILS